MRFKVFTSQIQSLRANAKQSSRFKILISHSERCTDGIIEYIQTISPEESLANINYTKPSPLPPLPLERGQTSHVILRGVQIGFLNRTKQIHPKNLLQILITSNPLPYPQTSHKTIHWIVLLGRVIGAVIALIYPSS